MSAATNPKPLRWYSFRWQTAVILAVVLVGAWYFLRGRFEHTMGSGPAGPVVALDSFRRAWFTNQFVLIGLGDSVTAGFGATAGHGYFELLVQNDDEQRPDMQGRDLQHVLSNLRIRNLAVSYTTSAEHLTDQLPHVGAYPADVRGIVLITTGGNDLIHDYGRTPPRDGAAYGCTYAQALQWKETLRARLKALLEGTMKAFPGGCEIFLANLYDPTDGVGDIQHANLLLPAWPDGLRVLALWNDVIAETCRDYPNVHLVDFHSEFLGHGIHCADRRSRYYHRDDPHYWYYENLEDPNDRGYDAIRRLFLIEMQKVFNR
jgi:lysophospholipase L1-like esterase